MTHEELEKAMQFVLEQQAQFASNQQQIDERVSRLETNMAEMALGVGGMARDMGKMARDVAQVAREVTEVARDVAEVAREVAEVARAQTHMNEVVAVMVDTHRHTEEKLDAFIGVLERYISQDRNGNGGGEEAA